jgi:hypothetical protein
LAYQNKLTLAKIAFMGDDLNDLAALQKAGWQLLLLMPLRKSKKVCAFYSETNRRAWSCQGTGRSDFESPGSWQEIVAEYAQQAGQGDKQ